MKLSGIPAVVLLLEGLVLFAIGVRELVTGSLVGAILGWGLGSVAILNAWAIERRRQPGSQ
jgi:hypothetical protein